MLGAGTGQRAEFPSVWVYSRIANASFFLPRGIMFLPLSGRPIGEEQRVSWAGHQASPALPQESRAGRAPRAQERPAGGG